MSGYWEVVIDCSDEIEMLQKRADELTDSYRFAGDLLREQRGHVSGLLEIVADPLSRKMLGEMDASLKYFDYYYDAWRSKNPSDFELAQKVEVELTKLKQKLNALPHK